MNLVVGVLLMIIIFLPREEFVTPVISGFQEFSTVDGENGLQAGDEILKVDGQRVFVQSDFSMLLSLNPSDHHDLVVRRNGEKILLDDLFMEKHVALDGNGERTMRYGINFSTEKATFGNKLSHGWNQSLNAVRMVWLSLKMLFTGQVGMNDMTGPVGIVDSMSTVAEQSDSASAALLNMTFFGGFIAINLGVMNMLPFPALDGGRVFALIVTTAIEKITRRKLNPKYEGYIHAAGMILLLALMAIVMFNDVYRIFAR